jgi:hypothetical protein
MTTIVRSIDVNVPVRPANQWIRFDEFTKFMEGVKQVTQMDAKRLHWKTEIAGQENEWVAKIVEQTPDKRIAWTSRDLPSAFGRALDDSPTGRKHHGVGLSTLLEMHWTHCHYVCRGSGTIQGVHRNARSRDRAWRDKV